MDNLTVNRAVKTMGVLKNLVCLRGYPSYSPDLLHLFSNPKKSLKGCEFLNNLEVVVATAEQNFNEQTPEFLFWKGERNWSKDVASVLNSVINMWNSI